MHPYNNSISISHTHDYYLLSSKNFALIGDLHTELAKVRKDRARQKARVATGCISGVVGYFLALKSRLRAAFTSRAGWARLLASALSYGGASGTHRWHYLTLLNVQVLLTFRNLAGWDALGEGGRDGGNNTLELVAESVIRNLSIPFTCGGD